MILLEMGCIIKSKLSSAKFAGLLLEQLEETINHLKLQHPNDHDKGLSSEKYRTAKGPKLILIKIPWVLESHVFIFI